MTLEKDLYKQREKDGMYRGLQNQMDYWQNLYRAVDEMLSMYGDDARVGELHGHLAEERHRAIHSYVIDWAQEDGLFVINHKGARLLMVMRIGSSDVDRWKFVDDEDFAISIDPHTVKHVKMASGRFGGALEVIV